MHKDALPCSSSVDFLTSVILRQVPSFRWQADVNVPRKAALKNLNIIYEQPKLHPPKKSVRSQWIFNDSNIGSASMMYLGMDAELPWPVRCHALAVIRHKEYSAPPRFFNRVTLARAFSGQFTPPS